MEVAPACSPWSGAGETTSALCCSAVAGACWVVEGWSAMLAGSPGTVGRDRFLGRWASDDESLADPGESDFDSGSDWWSEPGALGRGAIVDAPSGATWVAASIRSGGDAACWACLAAVYFEDYSALLPGSPPRAIPKGSELFSSLRLCRQPGLSEETQNKDDKRPTTKTINAQPVPPPPGPFFIE